MVLSLPFFIVILVKKNQAGLKTATLSNHVVLETCQYVYEL